LREAADHMVNHGVGRLPVIDRANPGRLVGMITRSDLLCAQRPRLEEMKLEKGGGIWAMGKGDGQKGRVAPNIG